MINALKERRSVRQYKDIKIEDEKIEQLLIAGRMAPSGKNKKPVEFIVVEDEDILNELGDAKPKGGLFLSHAPLAIVIVGKEEISDTWIEDCSIATTFIQLEAHNQGLGSCWVQIRARFDSEDKVKKMLNIENNKRVLCILSLGYPDEQMTAYREKDYRKAMKEGRVVDSQ